MKVFVTGATGVLGNAAVTALLEAGHDVSGLARSHDKAARLFASGVRPVVADLYDAAGLARAFAGHDAVCNLATHFPVGVAGLWPGAWRANDRIHTEGSRRVAEAAKRAGVCRLVQESVSFVYADGGDGWLDEDSPLLVTAATEPAAEAETNATAFGCAHRVTVVLRFGSLVGDDAATRWRLAHARADHSPVGEPEGWTHVLHPEDAGTAVATALHAPAGVYNVGAEPVRRSRLAAVFARPVGSRRSHLPLAVPRLVGRRFEPLARSHRVSSSRLAGQTGWAPRHPELSADWLRDLALSVR